MNSKFNTFADFLTRCGYPNVVLKELPEYTRVVEQFPVEERDGDMVVGNLTFRGIDKKVLDLLRNKLEDDGTLPVEAENAALMAGLDEEVLEVVSDDYNEFLHQRLSFLNPL